MLYNQIKDDLKVAMLNKDVAARDGLRMILSEINNQNMLYGKEITEELCLSIITKSVKMHNDSITQFKNAGRMDLAEKEEAEVNILKKYLPSILNEDETKIVLKKIITDNNIDLTQRSSIGLIMKHLSNRKDIDKGLASKLIKEL